MKRASWAPLLELLLPDETDRLLLKAVLLEDDACAVAATGWLGAVGSPSDFFRADRWGRRRLLPLLARSLRLARVGVSREFDATLRAAELYEQLRSNAFRREIAWILGRLRGVFPQLTVLPGVALVPRHYVDWTLRHCHDLDLWVPADDIPAAVAALTDDGLARVEPPAACGGSSILETASGLQVVLHPHLSPMRLFEPPADLMSGRRQLIDLDGTSVAALDDTGMLLVVLLCAACSTGRRSLRWVCDAVRLVAGPTAVEWDHFAEVALGTGAGLPLSVMLRYLAQDLGAAVPEGVVQRLADGTDLTPPVEEVLCHLVAADRAGRAERLLRCAPGLRARATLVRHLLFPSPSFLERELGVSGRHAVSREYASRARRAVGEAAVLLFGPHRAFGARVRAARPEARGA